MSYLVSKKALLEKLKYMGDYNIDMDYVTAEDIVSTPSVDAIIPEGVTNEDVLNDVLRKAFPRVIFIRSIDELNKTQGIHMSEEWLRQPYKGADMRGDT